MSVPADKDRAIAIAERLNNGEDVTLKTIQIEQRCGTSLATQLLERAQEIRTGWMLMKFARPTARKVAA